jgi:hypothetical protein
LLGDKKVRWILVGIFPLTEAVKKAFNPLLVWVAVGPAHLKHELANATADAASNLFPLTDSTGFEVSFHKPAPAPSPTGLKMLLFAPPRT